MDAQQLPYGPVNAVNAVSHDRHLAGLSYVQPLRICSAVRTVYSGLPYCNCRATTSCRWTGGTCKPTHKGNQDDETRPVIC